MGWGRCVCCKDEEEVSQGDWESSTSPSFPPRTTYCRRSPRSCRRGGGVRVYQAEYGIRLSVVGSLTPVPRSLVR